MKKQTAFFFYLLGGYVVLQFTWWGYHLIQLTKEITVSEQIVNKRIGMIIGEGMVFLLILVFGLYKIQKSIRKEHELAQRQNNFLLSVTHELKTPLASIKLYLQTLIKRNFEPEKRGELLQKAILENERLEEIVEALLISARIENKQLTIHRERINLTRLIQELKEKYNKKIGSEWIIIQADESFSINNDAFMLKTIFINLIENSLKYAGTKTAFTISIQQKEEELHIAFSDDGPGIPPDLQQVIFQKFVRLENEETRSKKGTGLGLFIVKEFTNLCGGEISYQQKQPTGSIFELRFEV
jgi:two-component system, OmpR family, phosphate regulon sensor histidine kinase PhoR